MKRAGLLCAAVLCLVGHLYAQESFFDNYVYQSWSSFGSLTGTTATDIVQTKDGYINVGTYEGLSRFDGVAFTTIKRTKENNLNFISVRAILEDSKGNLWLGSNDEGIQKISANGNKAYTTRNGLPNNSVRAIAEDKNGNIWIGTAAGVVYLTADGKLMTPQFEAGTVSKGVIATHLYCDTAGRVWLTTANERGLFLFSDGLFRTRPELDQFGTYFVTSIAQDLSGAFWIGMDNDGLIRVSNGLVTKIHTGTILDVSPTNTMYMEENGTIWFGTEKGLAVYSHGTFSEYTGSGLEKAHINKIIRDREDNIWLATDRNGIGKMTHGKFKVTKLESAANAIAEDADGRIWVATDTGVRCYENDAEVQNKLTEYTRGLRVRHIGVAANNDILVSCYSKPAQLRYIRKSGSIMSWSTDEGLAGNKIRVAIESNPGELYVGTTTGLSIIHADGTLRTFKQAQGLENEYVMCLFKDAAGVVWIGTDGGGIYLMKNEEIVSHITTDDGLVGNVIFKIWQDKDGAYWICTGGGITRCLDFDANTLVPAGFQNINSEQGIGTDSVFQIIKDASQNVWITSNHGITSLPLEEMLAAASGTTVKTQFYNRNDGLDSEGPTSTSLSICDRHGRLWFAMVDGIAVYDPVKVMKNPVMPLVHIETVSIDNVVYANASNVIVLKPGTKRVEIKVTGISFDAPERIQFTCRLTNFEDEFTSPNTQRLISYTNLNPGKHTFLVNAINGDGLISEQAEAMLFVQKPYFYQMPLFWFFAVLALFAIVIIVFYYKQRRIWREKVRLEKMVQERTAELAAEKDKSDLLLRAILPDKIADELKDGIHSIGENFDDVTLLFSDIVGFTKVSSGHTAEEIVKALNELFTRFDERAKRSGVEKIKTIGDAYMAACGIPTRNKEHARIMIDFAKGMYADLEDYNRTADIKFNIRVGLNCGPVTAGVIGKTKFIYDVWGNTVNVASRMETACTPGHIRVTEAVKNHLLESGIKFSEPMECDIKGKGMMTTYEVL